MDKMELIAIAEKRGEFELMEFLEGITLKKVPRGTLPVRQIVNKGVMSIPAFMVNSGSGDGRSKNARRLAVRRLR